MPIEKAEVSYSSFVCLFFVCFVQVQALVRQTLEVIMVQNSGNCVLLSWVIDRCYTGSRSVVDGCFNALAKAFYGK